jgi:cell division protein FtsN
MRFNRNIASLSLLWGWLLSGCALIDDSTPRKTEPGGLIATPPTYYSTTKARYLGTKYKANLDRLVERITRNPQTASLQFANNIASVGGIGFFTHSATKTADERYLEVVLATPETFEGKGGFNEKVQRVVGNYGLELLAILSGDNEIYQDREMSGYGLNLAWRNVVSQSSGNRVALERAIIYFPKEQVRNLVRQAVNLNELLADVVIFAVEEDGPLKLVSYRPEEPRPDVRAAIQEANLSGASSPPRTVGTGARTTASDKPVQAQRADRAPVPPESGSRESVVSNREDRPPPLAGPVSLSSSMKPDPVGSQQLETHSPSNALRAEGLPKQAVSPVADALPRTEPNGEARVAPLAALRSSTGANTAESSSIARPTAKPLEGYVIQLAYNDRERAQRWAESMTRRGFAVSITEAGSDGSLRVRVGNFNTRDDAERQLKLLKPDGLTGIVVSLPRTVRPVAHSSMP